MTSPYEMFQTKKLDLSDEPTEFDYGDFQIYCKYGGINNRAFINTYQVKMKKFARRDNMAKQGQLAEDAVQKLEKQKTKALAELYADHIIVGWKGVTDIDGKPIDYNKENVVKLLTDLDPLFKDIVEQCAVDANFAKEQEDKEVKNLKKS